MADALKNVGGGAATGAAIGSVIPGLGTAAGAIIGGGIGLAKSIIGGVQAAKGKKQLNSLLANRPQYEISKGYLDAYNLYKQMASSDMPGYREQLDQVGQSTARTQDYLREGAMSSSQYMSGALSAQDKELEAIRNLGIANAQWRSQQQQNLAQEQNRMGTLQDTMFQQNKLDPWNIKANMANERYVGGMQNLFGGASEASSAFMNYAGTRSMIDMYKSLYPQGGGSVGSMPGTTMARFNLGMAQRQYAPNPQQDLLTTLQGMRINPTSPQ